jgi:hypothetical protein
MPRRSRDTPRKASQFTNIPKFTALLYDQIPWLEAQCRTTCHPLLRRIYLQLLPTILTTVPLDPRVLWVQSHTSDTCTCTLLPPLFRQLPRQLLTALDHNQTKFERHERMASACEDPGKMTPMTMKPGDQRICLLRDNVGQSEKLTCLFRQAFSGTRKTSQLIITTTLGCPLPNLLIIKNGQRARGRSSFQVKRHSR